LRCSHVDCLPVAVQHQHNRLVQYVRHKSFVMRERNPRNAARCLSCHVLRITRHSAEVFVLCWNQFRKQHRRAKIGAQYCKSGARC
jgi:hypothetical protein